jgi:hypothetical protein
VRDHWDEIRMSCTVVDQGETVEYQDASVAEFWTPAEMLQGARDSVVPVPGAIILFSGTVVTLEEKLRFAELWTLRMTDPVLGREITHTYRVEVLATEVLNDGSASGDVAKGETVIASALRRLRTLPRAPGCRGAAYPGPCAGVRAGSSIRTATRRTCR